MNRVCAECSEFQPQDKKNGNCYCKKRDSYIDGNNNVCNSFKLDKYRSYSEVQEARRYCQKFQATGCYITTIVVGLLKKDDNCQELNALRFLRNEIMQKNPEYVRLLIEYDMLGPIISKYLVKLENKYDFARMLYNVYIKYCVQLIQIGDYEGAIDFYIEMFNLLKKEVLSSYTLPDNIEKSFNPSAIGHGRYI